MIDIWMFEEERDRCFTVFPVDEDYMPQDFPTWNEAEEYAQNLPCAYSIEEVL